MCGQEEQPIYLKDFCRILFSDHNVQCSQDSDPNRKNGFSQPKIINGKNIQGCSSGHYVIKHQGQSLNSNVNSIILNQHQFPITPYIQQISNRQHCHEYFEKAQYVYQDDCDILQSNTIQVNLDEHVYIQSKEDFSFIEVMSDAQFPFHSSCSSQGGCTQNSSTQTTSTSDQRRDDKSNTNSNLLFNRLFNTWNQIISEEMFTLIETLGEIKIYNHSNDYVLNILDIIQDTNIITIADKKQDIQSNKERTIKFSVIPEVEGKNQEINLYFKIRFYDTRLMKPVSFRTVQYTITLAKVKANLFAIHPLNLGKVSSGQMSQQSITITNPYGFDLQISEMSFLKKYIYTVENIENFVQGEKNHILYYKDMQKKERWHLKSNKEVHIVDIVTYQNQTGTFTDYLKLYFESSPLVIQIPIRFKVVTHSLSFINPYLFMGVISSRQGYNSRSIIIENNSNSTVEISDIIIHFKNQYSCMQAEVILDIDANKLKTNQSPYILPYQQQQRVGCLLQNKKLLVKPFELNKKIGVLKIFPKGLDPSSQQRMFEGRIQIVTNNTLFDIEQDFKFFRYEQMMNYTQALTQFKVAVNPDDTVNSSTYIPSTKVPSEKRVFEIINNFSSQVRITALKKPPVTNYFNFDQHIQITEFQETKLEVGEKKGIFTFQLIGNATKVDTYIFIEFNRNFVIPIFFKVYNMHLLCSINSVSDFYDCSELSQHELIKFGNKAINKTAVQELRIKNDNPEVITIYGISKLSSPVNIILKKQMNYLGQIQQSSQNRVIVETGKKTPLMYIGPNDEAIFTIELNTQNIVKSYNNLIQTTTNYEQFSFLMEFNVVSGDIELNPPTIHFRRLINEQDMPQTVYIKNTYDVALKILDFQISDPRFQILNFTRTIPAKSTKPLLTLIFNSTFGYGQNIKQTNDDNFISIEDMIMWNITQSMLENAEKNILSADVIVNFDIKSIFISASAEVQQLKLINENVIDFNNTETNQFYSKTLSFNNPLDVPISFQLYIAPQNISSPENYISKQTQFQQEVEFIFFVPYHHFKNDPIVKDVYDNLSVFFTNKEYVNSTEIQNSEVVKNYSNNPDFDRSQEKILVQCSELIKQYQIYFEDLENLEITSNGQSDQKNHNSNNVNNNNGNIQNSGYKCKLGFMTQKIKNYLLKIEFTKQLVEFYREPQKHIQKMKETMMQVQSLKREVIEITQTTRNRPSLFNYNMKVEKGLWEKIKHFLTFGLFTSSTTQENTVSDWQSQQFSFSDWQNQLSNGSKSKPNGLQTQQQFFLSSDVLNKTIVIQPKQTMDINSLIYLPKYGDTQNNLIIKSNASGIDIIPIIGRSGVGKIQLIDIKNMSPLLFSQLQSQKNKSVEEMQYRQFIQESINDNVFLYSLNQEELDGAQKHNVDNMKNFIIKNVGQFPISIKNIYIESQPCAAYGFFILGCSCQFKLEPQQEKTITIGYKTDYPYDTLEKNIYFYTQTYHIQFKLRAEFYHKPISPIAQISPIISPSLANKKVADSLIEIFNENGGNLFGIDFEKDLSSENSEKLLAAFLENVEKATAAAQQNLENKEDDEEIDQQQNVLTNDWSWMTEKMQHYFAKNPSVTIKDNINPYFNYFIISIIFMTALFFLYTFISFIYQDILSLNSKKGKYDSYSTRSQSASISVQNVAPLSPRTTSNQANQNNKQKKNSAQSSQVSEPNSDKGSYDISLFIKSNKLDQQTLNLKGELQKIKEFQEKQQQELRLQKQKQVQLRRNKEKALEELKLSQAQQFLAHEKQMQKDYFENNSDKEDDGLEDEEEYDFKPNIVNEQQQNQTTYTIEQRQDQENTKEQQGRTKSNSNQIEDESQTNQDSQSKAQQIKANANKKNLKEKQKKQSKREKEREKVVVITKENETRSKQNSQDTTEGKQQPQSRKQSCKSNKQYENENSEEEYDDEISIVRKNSNKSSSSATVTNASQTNSQVQLDTRKSSAINTPLPQSAQSRVKDESIQKEIEQLYQRQKVKETSTQQQQTQQQQKNQNNQKQLQQNVQNQIKQTGISLQIDTKYSKNQSPFSDQQTQQQQATQKITEDLINQWGGQNQSAASKRKKSENFIVDDFHQANEITIQNQGQNSYSLSQQQQMQKKNFLVHDHISSCGEDDDNKVSSNSNIRKKKISKASQDIITQFPQIQQLVDQSMKTPFQLSTPPNKQGQNLDDENKYKNISIQQSPHPFNKEANKEEKRLMSQNEPDIDYMDNPLLQKLTASYSSNNSNTNYNLVQNNLKQQLSIQSTNSQPDQTLSNTKKNNQQDQEEEEFDENQSKSNEQNPQSSESSQLSSGDSLSEEDIDNFKRSNEQIKAIGFTRLGQFQGSFLGNDDDNNSTYSNNNNNSMRNSQNLSKENHQQSYNSIPSQGNLNNKDVPNQNYNNNNTYGHSRFSYNSNQNNTQNETQRYFLYQSESSDDDVSQPIQKRYFNVFQQPTYYPINLLSQNNPVDMSSSIDPLGGENSFSSDTQQLNLGVFTHNRTSSNQFSPSQSQSFQAPVISNNNNNGNNNRNFNSISGNQSGSQTLIDATNPANLLLFNGGASFNPTATNPYLGVQNQKFVNAQQLSFMNTIANRDSETEFFSDEQPQTIFNPSNIQITSSLSSESHKNDNSQANRQVNQQRNTTSFNFPHMSNSRNPYPSNGNISKKMPTKSSQNDLEEASTILIQQQQQLNFQKQFNQPGFGSITNIKQTNPNAIKFPTLGPPPGMSMVPTDNQKIMKNSSSSNSNQNDPYKATELKFDVSAPPGLLGQSSKNNQ